MADYSRRRLLQLGGVAAATGLAGCSSVKDQINDRLNLDSDESDELPEDSPLREEEHEQQYTIPPVAKLESEGVPDSDGQVTLDAIFATAVNHKKGTDPHIYFEDEVTFELFVYDTYPVGNEVDLKKVAEKTTTPYDSVMVKFRVPYEDLPKNQQMRFRVKVTNNNTGDSEWQMDQQVFDYAEFGEDRTVVLSSDDMTVLDGEDHNRYIGDLLNMGDEYAIDYRGSSYFTYSEIVEEVPYCRQAAQKKYDDWESHPHDPPTCKPFSGTRIEFSKSHTDLATHLMDKYGVEELNGFTFKAPVPSDYDFYGRDHYDVLSHPIYQKKAEALKKGQEAYGVENHYGMIKQATAEIQATEYDRRDGTIRGAPIRLPEDFLKKHGKENCVGKTYQLCWYLYNMGYTCAGVWVDIESDFNPDHMGVGIPIPREVLESDFPDGYAEEVSEGGIIDHIDGVSERVGPDVRPDSLGEHPWLYIETTGAYQLGIVPHEGASEMEVRYALEPEDNVFGTDIGGLNENNRLPIL